MAWLLPESPLMCHGHGWAPSGVEILDHCSMHCLYSKAWPLLVGSAGFTGSPGPQVRPQHPNNTRSDTAVLEWGSVLQELWLPPGQSTNTGIANPEKVGRGLASLQLNTEASNPSRRGRRRAVHLVTTLLMISLLAPSFFLDHKPSELCHLVEFNETVCE